MKAVVIFLILLLSVATPMLSRGEGPAEVEKIVLKSVRVDTGGLLSESEITEVSRPFLGSEVSYENLEEIRHRLTQRLIAKGYINSGVVIPDQEVVDGEVRFQVLAGELTRVDIKGEHTYSPGWLERRLRRGTDGPLNIYTLQKNLQLLQFEQPVSRLHAELKAGEKAGESLLTAEIEESPPFRATVDFSNNSPPGTGACRGSLTLGYTNLLGRGDFIEGTIGLTEGDTDYALRAMIPLNAQDTAITLYTSRSDSTVIEDSLRDLDIESRSTTFGIKLSQPFYLSLNSEFTLALAGELRKDETSLLDSPFSFSPGVEDGEAKTTVLRFSQEYIRRSTSSVLALASSFNIGIDAFGATVHSSPLPDGRFFSWLGQLRYLRQLAGNQLVVRLDTQLTDDRLLPMEKFAVGGLNSVRGYRKDYLVRDSGVSGTLEARIPLSGTVDGTGVTVIPFYDFGYARDRSPHSGDGDFIHSIGAGVRWRPLPALSTEAYYGYAFSDPIDLEESDPQDDGWHFAVSWTWP